MPRRTPTIEPDQVTSEAASDDAAFFRPRKSRASDDESASPLTDEYADADESAFLRGKKRVPVRKGGVPKRTARRFIIGASVVFIVIAATLAAIDLYTYGTRDGRFRIETSDNIETATLKNVSRAQVLDVFGADIGRNIFFVPLAARRQQLEQIPWIESATVMRLLPDRIRVEVTERTPVAFVEIAGRIGLIDANGVVMDLPRSGEHYSFPVITGMRRSSEEPLSVRAARMQIYARLVSDLNANGANYARDLSEVDLSDPTDARITVGDANGTVLVHLGDTDFQKRYRFYIEHINGWRQQYQVHSVDLRYDGQVIVNREGQPAASEAKAQ